MDIGSDSAFAERSIRRTRRAVRIVLMVLAVTGCLMLILGSDNQFIVGLVLAICIVVAPAVYLLREHLVARIRRKEAEAGLIENFKLYSQIIEKESVNSWVDRELLASKVDGRKLPLQDFLTFQGTPANPPAGSPALCLTLAHRSAVRTLYDQHFTNLATMMPQPVRVALDELLSPAAEANSEAFGSWTAGGQNLTITYSRAVLDEIRIQATEGFARMRHGGVEVGGVLFGTHREGCLRILAGQPMSCAYAYGPRFVLSEQDEAALADLLQSCAADPDLAGLEPVGWYHSHTREEICLSDADVRLFDRFFPLPWQVALVVRPGILTPTRAGFFFREPDGALRTDASHGEFQLGTTPAFVAA